MKKKALENKSDSQKHKKTIEIIKSEIIKISAVPVNMLVMPKTFNVEIKRVI